MPTITLTRENDWYLITDEETGVTTRGESKLEGLLMLADALAASEHTDVDLVGTAIEVFGPTPARPLPDLADSDRGIPDDFDVVVDESIEDRFHDAAGELDLDDDRAGSTDALRERLARYAHLGKPWLTPPLSPDEIEAIEDDRLRALAWDLDAVARAYNYATDPTLPDLARSDPSPWIAPAERIRLERAAVLLVDVYARLLDRGGDELPHHHGRSTGG